MLHSLKKQLISHLSHRKFNSQSAFTLVELIVVVVIIGILSSIAIPSFQNASDKAKQKEASSMIASYLKAAQAYYTEYGQGARYSSQIGEYVAVTGCRQFNPQYCKSNNSASVNWSNTNRNQWYTPTGNYRIYMQLSGSRLNFLAYPQNAQSGLGVVGCYDYVSGATKLKENGANEKGNRYVRNVNCR